MDPSIVEVGMYPPQQARSRDSLRRILVSAEDVLARDGFDNFTMSAVADHAGISVGSIYRRFTGKEPLLTEVKRRLLGALEAELEGNLGAAEDDLASKIHAFARTLGDCFSVNRRVFPELLMVRPGSELEEPGKKAIAATKRLFDEATEPFVAEIRRADPRAGLTAVQQMVTGACIHQAAMAQDTAESEFEWRWYAEQLAAMAIAYLGLADPSP